MPLRPGVFLTAQICRPSARNTWFALVARVILPKIFVRVSATKKYGRKKQYSSPPSRPTIRSRSSGHYLIEKTNHTIHIIRPPSLTFVQAPNVEHRADSNISCVENSQDSLVVGESDKIQAENSPNGVSVPLLKSLVARDLTFRSSNAIYTSFYARLDWWSLLYLEDKGLQDPPLSIAPKSSDTIVLYGSMPMIAFDQGVRIPSWVAESSFVEARGTW